MKKKLVLQFYTLRCLIVKISRTTTVNRLDFNITPHLELLNKKPHANCCQDGMVPQPYQVFR